MSLLVDIEEVLENAIVDFHGQFYSTVAMWVITSLFGVFGFVVGYYKQSFAETLKLILVGTGTSLVICALPWPIYSWNKIEWKKIPSD